MHVNNLIKQVTKILAILLFIFSASYSQTALAATSIVQTYYVPITEPQARTWMNAQTTTTENDTIHSVISITGTYNGTTVYYDNWEDGYEDDITNPQQSTTQVITINAGQVITFNDDIPVANGIRDQGNLYHDGMDKISATQQIVVTRALWPNGAPQAIGTQLAGAVEVFETSKWGNSFEVPVGINNGQASFNYTAVSIIAQKNGTSVTVRNTDPSVNVTQTLNEGQTLYVEGIKVGATVTSTGGPVQVDMLTADQPSTYDGRLYSLLPISGLGNTYYSPVSTTREGGGAMVYNNLIAYNPNSTTIQVNITCMAGTGGCPASQSLAAHTARFFQLPLSPTSPNTLTGAKLSSTGGENFYALAAVDINNTVHNWGFNMIPETSLTTSAVVGWSPGTTDLARDANPIWVTPVANTTIYIDYDGDPATGPIVDSLGNHCDVSMNVTALEAQKIFAPSSTNYDHSGWRVYTTDNTRIAVAYGQDGGSSSGSQPTELDLGTTVLPFPSLVAYKSAALIGDFNNNGGIDPGELLEYTIKVHNSGIVPISNVNLLDTLDANTTYVADTTTMDGSPLSDNASGTRFPLDNPGYPIPSTIQPGQDMLFTFQATVNNPLSPPSTSELINTAKVASIAEIFLNARTSIVQQGILTVQKTSSASPNSVKPGDTITYTVTVTNTSSTPQTGIQVTDSLPDGTDYVLQSTAVTGHRQKLVMDKFNQLLYTNNDGPENWVGNWSESDGTQSPAAGNVQVTNGSLRLTANGSWASRTVDLTTGITGQNFSSATLTFDFRTSPTVATGDAVQVVMSGNGHALTTIDTITGITGQTSGSRSYDISSYIGSDTTVRFRVSSGYAAKYFYVDNVAIKTNELLASVIKDNKPSSGNAQLKSGVPPTLVRQDDGFALAASEFMTITYKVTVKIPVNETRIVNTATATSYEKAPSASSTTIDPVSTGGTIGDLVWLDTVVNGTYDYGEPGLYNVRVWLDKDDNGSNDFETLTGTDGKYIFDGLLPGNYRVKIDPSTIPAGLTLSTSLPPLITITGNETSLGNDFGYKTANSTVGIIGNYIWSDANNNGLQDSGEVGIGGVTVELRASPGGAFVSTTSTNAFGIYLFTNIAPGIYTVTVTDTASKLSGYTATTGLQSLGKAVGVPSDPLTVAGGNSYMMMDLGFYNSSLFSISNKLWFDSNNNASLDTGEPGIKDVTITLLDSNGNVKGATLSDVNGSFFFTGVPNGNYTIKIEDATGNLIGYAGTTSAAQAGALAVTVSGSNVSGTAFGYNAPGRIGDKVWNDLDRDGIQDAGEPGIQGVTVQLYKDTNGDGIFNPAVDQLKATTTTDSNGNYMFQVSEAGRFFVNIDNTQSALSGLTLTTRDDETYQGVQIQVDFLNLNTSFLTADFGFGTPATIAGVVWNDTNRNGSGDSGETGIQGVSVKIYKDTNSDGVFNPAVDQLLSTLITDANGHYAFPVTETGRFFISVDANQTPLLGKTLTTSDDQAYAGAQITVNLPNVNTFYTNGNFGYAAPAPSALTVTKSSNPSGDVNQGDTITYTVTVTNTSATRQTGITVNDPLPANTSYIANSTSATGKATVTGTATLIADKDTYINQNSPTFNYGGSAQLGIYVRSGQSQRPLMHFDLSSIPAGATITSATIQFYVSTRNTNITSVNLYRLTRDWTEGTQTGAACTGGGANYTTYNCSNSWTTAGGDYNATVIGSFVPNSVGYKNVDVTSLVQGWYGGTNSNYGVILIGSNTSNNSQAYISSRSVVNQQPTLVVNYTLSSVTKNNGGGPYLLSNGVPPDLVVPADGFILDQNDTLTVTFRVTVNNPLPPDVYKIINQATATSNESGPAIGSVTNRAPLLQDLQVTKVVNAISDPCTVGSCQVTYLVTVANVGRNAETNVQVTDSLPSQLQYLSNTPSQGSYVSGTGIWSVGNLGSGSSATLQITAKVTGFSSSIQNCAGLTASAPADTNPANNTGCVSITPTHVFLSGFRAYEDNGRMVIEWTTSSETGTAGFYLLRKDNSTGVYQRINHRMLPSLLTSLLGGIYSLIDNTASPDSKYTYALIEIENTGAKKVYGPFTVSAGGFAEIENPDMSGSIDPDMLLSSAENAIRSNEKITKTASINGVITYSNSKDSNAGISSSGRDLYSSYTKTANEPSNARTAALKSVKYAESTGAVKVASYGTNVKISVSKDGLYFLPASKIASVMGYSEQVVKSYIKYNYFSLTNQGQAVAYSHDDSNSGILFYGHGIESIYTNENVYWLSFGQGLPMAGITGTGSAPASGDNTFSETVHAEENKIVVPVLFDNPETDYWFWDVIVGNDPIDGSKQFSVSANGKAASSEASLTIYLQGFTNAKHHVKVSLNGVDNVIGDDSWEGLGPKTFTFDCKGFLKEEDNSVEIKGIQDDEGALWSIFYVDSIDLTYQRLYRAVDNTLVCRGDGNSPVTISGFTGPDILLFDITVPLNPRTIMSKTISGASGDYAVSFTPATPGAIYLALLSNAALPVNKIKVAAQTRLKTQSNFANYVVISTRELASAANILAAYRQKQGFYAKVVLLEDLMNEFNYGIYDPRTVKTFLSYAYHNWIKPPKYVVLAGNGTFDYKDNMGKGDNLVPTLMAPTPMGLYPSDNLFTEVDADNLPKMAIGRLPVHTAQELQDVVNKIMSYESTGGNLFVAAADINDDGGNFTEDSDAVAALAPQKYAIEKIYLSQHPLNEARSILMDRINRGAIYLNFIGHSGPGQLGKYGLLTKQDLSAMTNSRGLHILTAMTCLMGQYGIPGYDSLSESLLLTKSVGSVAVWSPSGYSFNSSARILDEEFFKAAFISKKTLLGDALLKAFTGYNTAGGQRFMIDIYNLQGDPALKLK